MKSSGKRFERRNRFICRFSPNVCQTWRRAWICRSRDPRKARKRWNSQLLMPSILLKSWKAFLNNDGIIYALHSPLVRSRYFSNQRLFVVGEVKIAPREDKKDDLTTAGMIRRLQIWWDKLSELGQDRIQDKDTFQKSWIIVKEQYKDLARVVIGSLTSKLQRLSHKLHIHV